MPDFIVNEIKKKDSEGFEERRFVICRPDGTVLDDAQGFGYRTRQKAFKAGLYRFKGGRGRQQAISTAARAFWKTHKDKIDDVETMTFYAMKDGTSDKDLDEEIRDYFVRKNIKGFDLKFLKHIP